MNMIKHKAMTPTKATKTSNSELKKSLKGNFVLPHVNIFRATESGWTLDK